MTRRIILDVLLGKLMGWELNCCGLRAGSKLLGSPLMTKGHSP